MLPGLTLKSSENSPGGRRPGLHDLPQRNPEKVCAVGEERIGVGGRVRANRNRKVFDHADPRQSIQARIFNNPTFRQDRKILPLGQRNRVGLRALQSRACLWRDVNEVALRVPPPVAVRVAEAHRWPAVDGTATARGISGSLVAIPAASHLPSGEIPSKASSGSEVILRRPLPSR